MSASAPVFSQWRTSDKIFLFKQAQPDELLVRVYDTAYNCLSKTRVPLSEIDYLPETITIRSQPRTVMESLFKRCILGANFFLPEISNVEISYCKKLLQKAISKLKPLSEEEACPELEQLCCPITQEPFVDPVICDQGHTFERSAIERHFNGKAKAVCPISRAEISNNFKPNYAVKKILDEHRSNNQVPNKTHFKQENDKLAQANADLAEAYLEESKYSKALEQYSEMVKHSKNPQLYKKVADLFDAMNDSQKGLLARLYLVEYYLDADDTESACKTLKQALSQPNGTIEITETLINLYLYNQDLDSIIALFSDLPEYNDAKDQNKLLCLCDKIIDHHPTAYRLYAPLAKGLRDPQKVQHLYLRGACESIQDGKFSEALAFCNKIEKSAPFIDHLIHLSALRLSGKTHLVAPELEALSDYFGSQSDREEDKIKASKQLAFLDPSSDVFKTIINGYQSLNQTSKSLRWYNKWLSYLIEDESWEEAEEVALEAKKLTKDTLSINEQLEIIYGNIDADKIKAIYIELGASYLENHQWDKAERVYQLGYSRFKCFELAYGLAGAQSNLSKMELAAKQYFKATEEALLEQKGHLLTSCIERIKKINPRMDFLDEDQKMHLLMQERIVRFDKEVKELQGQVKDLELKLVSAQSTSPSHSAAAASSFTGKSLVQYAFGAKEWKKYVGNVGPEPALPADIEALYRRLAHFGAAKL